MVVVHPSKETYIPFINIIIQLDELHKRFLKTGLQLNVYEHVCL